MDHFKNSERLERIINSMRRHLRSILIEITSHKRSNLSSISEELSESLHSSEDPESPSQSHLESYLGNECSVEQERIEAFQAQI